MSEEKEAPKTVIDARVIGIWIVILAVVLALIYLMLDARAAKNDLRAAKTQFAADLDNAKRNEAIRMTEALAAALMPLVVRRQNEPQVLQSVCEAMVGPSRLDEVVITDSKGVVLGTSNLKYSGQAISEMATQTIGERKADGMWEVTRPILQNEARVGCLRIRVK